MTTTTIALIAGLLVLAITTLWIGCLYASVKAELAVMRELDRDRWRAMHRDARRGR